MFFSGYPRLIGLQHFPALQYLCVADQKLERIANLQCCPQLKELWLIECHIHVHKIIHIMLIR